MRGQPGVWACPGSAGASAVPAGGLSSGLCMQPPPHLRRAGLQACHSSWPSPVLFSAQVSTGCLCTPSAFACRVRNPFFLEMKPPASWNSTSQCPPASSWTCSSSVPCQPPALAPAHGALWVPPAHTDLPLAQKCWLAQAQAGPVVLLSSLGSREQTGEAHGLVGKRAQSRGDTPASGDTAGDFVRLRSVKTAFPLFCVPSVTGCSEV